MHNNDLERYDYSGGFESSPLGSLSNAAQFGIVGSFVGIFGFAVVDALLGVGEWALLPEGVVGLAMYFGIRFYFKKNRIDLFAQFKNLNWDALLPGYDPEARAVEGTVIEMLAGEDGEPKDDSIGVAPPVFPLHPDDETLKLGYVVETGARFDPHINMLFGQGMIASAVQGSGKSMLNGVIIEQAGKCGVPIIIFDHKGEYAPIVDLPFINGLRAGSASLRAKIGNGCFELTENDADDFVQLVMSPDEHGKYRQAIIHLPSYGDAWVDRASIVAEVGQALMRRSTRLREQEIEPIPCLILMDEAQLYIPQNVDLLPPEARENKKTLSSLNNAYFALVSNGRSNGYTVLFATQSLTYIAKWAIKSCQIRVFMRHTEKNDLDMCGDIIDRGVATREKIEAFPKGTGVVFGFTMKPMVVHFDKKQSQDKSETPGLDRLRNRQAPKQQQIPGLSMEALPFKADPASIRSSKTSLDIDTVLAIMEEHGSKLSDEAVKALFDLLPDVNRDEQKGNAQVLYMADEPMASLPIANQQKPTLLERGLKAYEEGFTTIDDLAARLAITQWEARNLRSQIKVALKQEDLCE